MQLIYIVGTATSCTTHRDLNLWTNKHSTSRGSSAKTSRRPKRRRIGTRKTSNTTWPRNTDTSRTRSRSTTGRWTSYPNTNAHHTKKRTSFHSTKRFPRNSNSRLPSKWLTRYFHTKRSSRRRPTSSTTASERKGGSTSNATILHLKNCTVVTWNPMQIKFRIRWIKRGRKIIIRNY